MLNDDTLAWLVLYNEYLEGKEANKGIDEEEQRIRHRFSQNFSLYTTFKNKISGGNMTKRLVPRSAEIAQRGIVSIAIIEVTVLLGILISVIALVNK